MVAVRCFVTDRDGETVPLAGDDHLSCFTEISGCESIGNAFIGADPLFPRAGVAGLWIRTKEDAAELRAELALRSIYRWNYRPSLLDHMNPCRLYGLNDGSGTLICTYPQG